MLYFIAQIVLFIATGVLYFVDALVNIMCEQGFRWSIKLTNLAHNFDQSMEFCNLFLVSTVTSKSRHGRYVAGFLFNSMSGYRITPSQFLLVKYEAQYSVQTLACTGNTRVTENLELDNNASAVKKK